MGINKYLIIFFIICIIIISLSIFNFFVKGNDKNNNYLEKNEYKVEKNEYKIEKFSNSQEVKTKEYNNLIKNSSFENGKDSINHITQSGYNKIVMLKNPGSTPYVLEQQKTDNLTYYQFICENDKNSKYNLYFWLSIENNNINNLDFEKLIKVKIENEDYSNNIPRLNYNIVQKVILSNNDENTWYLIKYDFVSSNNTKDKIEIYLNYDNNLQYNKYYFTGISLYRVLIDAENFIYNNKLISYIDGYHYESNTPTLHDLSGVGNDLFWSNIPNTNYTEGFMTMFNTKIIGFPTNKMSNQKFTIIFCLNKNFENSASDEFNNNLEANSESDDNGSDFDANNNSLFLLSMPGNERYSFEIKFKENYIYLINGNDEYKSKNEIILYNKSILSVTYSKNIINIYHDGYNVLSQKIKNIYFSSDNIVINRNKNLNFNLYSILFYNRVIDKKELDDIRTYFITNQDKNFNTPDINTYHMNNTAEYTVNSDNYQFKPFSTNQSSNQKIENIFIDTFDNQHFKMNKDNKTNTCDTDCTKLCKPFFNSTDTDKYNQCISTCQNVLKSCENYCTDEENTDSIYCNKINNLNNINNNNNGCPIVYKKKGKYMIYVDPKSDYAKKINFSGERSYGSKLSKARQTYNVNFPQCPTPNDLIESSSAKNFIQTCPYTINEANPCHMSACSGVNWDVTDHNNLNLNEKCKKMVANYCQTNYNIDDNCSCWNPDNKDLEECSSFKRYFEDPNENCSPGQFKIEEHPEFSKYIRKDNIPCWGCNITM